MEKESKTFESPWVLQLNTFVSPPSLLSCKPPENVTLAKEILILQGMSEFRIYARKIKKSVPQ